MSSCSHTWSPAHYRSCPYCEGDRNREAVEALRATILEFKATSDRSEEVRLGKLMRALGHPDVDGLLAWKAGQR